MTADILPDEVDFVFCPEALPDEDLHRIVLVVEGVDRVRRAAPSCQRIGERRRILSQASSPPGHHRRGAAPGASIRRARR